MLKLPASSNCAKKGLLGPLFVSFVKKFILPLEEFRAVIIHTSANSAS